VKPKTPVTADVGRYLGAGLTWALATLLFLAAGAWLGERLGSRSVGALIGAFVGASAGFVWMVRQLTAGGGSGPGSSGSRASGGTESGRASGSGRGQGGRSLSSGSGVASGDPSGSANRPGARSDDVPGDDLSGADGGRNGMEADGDVKGKRDV